MASLLGEDVGGTVGYQTRDERRIGAGTRIEVVTEGVLTRRLQHDPTLDGVGLVIFDEVHELGLEHGATELPALAVLATDALRGGDDEVVELLRRRERDPALACDLLAAETRLDLSDLGQRLQQPALDHAFASSFLLDS